MIVGEDELEYHFCPKHKVPVKVRPKRREYLYGRRRRRR